MIRLMVRLPSGNLLHVLKLNLAKVDFTFHPSEIDKINRALLDLID